VDESPDCRDRAARDSMRMNLIGMPNRPSNCAVKSASVDLPTWLATEQNSIKRYAGTNSVTAAVEVLGASRVMVSVI
jgi:hypothetical protein